MKSAMKKYLLALMLFTALPAQAVTISPVNVGSAANDGTGDTTRAAFTKVNSSLTALNSGTANYLAGYDANGFLTYYQPGANCTISSGVFNCTGGTGSSYTPPVTTKGDIFTYSTAPARLPVGTDGQVLSASSSAATGLAWIAAPSGGSSPTGTNNTVARFNGSGALVSDQVTSDGAGAIGAVNSVTSSGVMALAATGFTYTASTSTGHSLKIGSNTKLQIASTVTNSYQDIAETGKITASSTVAGTNLLLGELTTTVSTATSTLAASATVKINTYTLSANVTGWTLPAPAATAATPTVCFAIVENSTGGFSFSGPPSNVKGFMAINTAENARNYQCLDWIPSLSLYVANSAGVTGI